MTTKLGRYARLFETQFRNLCKSADRVVRMPTGADLTLAAVWNAPGNPQYAKIEGPVHVGVQIKQFELKNDPEGCFRDKLTELKDANRLNGFDVKKGSWRK